jgi:hypothetical protein
MAGKLLVARESFSTVLDGKEVLVHLGQVVPAGHKLAKAHKHLFAPVEPRADVETLEPPAAKKRRPKK